ncbi:MAG: heparan-alpha-glucosaminide N-acetyltransferase domain-containing protein [Sandaracinaceae bacterium]
MTQRARSIAPTPGLPWNRVDETPRATAGALPAEATARTVARARGASKRIHFVDLLRLIASVQMIHGHTMNALMADDLRHGTLYQNWTWARGLVSVAFMVAAGLSFHLSTLARFEKHKADRRKVIARFRRAGWLILLGYLLHFPAAIFVGGEVGPALREFAYVDVLQCIGVCILVLQALTMLCSDPKTVVRASFVIAVGCFALAPLGETVSPEGPWRWLINYVTHQGGSLFPLLPWAGFVFAGVVVADVALPQGVRTTKDPLPRLALCTAAVLGIWAVAELVPFTLVTDETSRNSHPAFNVLKLGLVLAITTGLAVVGKGITRLPRWAEVLAGESLSLYVSHLLVLYIGGIGLYRLYGHSLDLATSMTVAIVMIVLTLLFGLLFHRHKVWRKARWGW